MKSIPSIPKFRMIELCIELGCESEADIELGWHRTHYGSELMAGLRGTEPTYLWDDDEGWLLVGNGYLGKQWG